MKTLGLILLTLSLAGCATHNPTLGPRDARGIIASDELAAQPFATAYEAIYALRNWWIRERRGGLGPAVYRDDNRLPGGYLVLHRVSLETVYELRFLDRAQAVTLWGPTLEDRPGVIQIITPSDSL